MFSYEFYLIEDYNVYLDSDFNKEFKEDLKENKNDPTDILIIISKVDSVAKFSASFSSYPGTISSTDDFYVTNNKIIVTETTLDVLDMSLYQNIPAESEYIPNYMRVNSATFFSKSGVFKLLLIFF